MEIIKGILIGMFIGTTALFAYAMCYTSSKCDSLKEEQYKDENV